MIPYTERLVSGAIRLVIPGMRLVSESNVRQHWSKRYKRSAQHRALVAAIVRARVGKCPPVEVELIYHSSKRMDPGNIAAAFKAVQDGIADALGVDDGDHRFYTWSYVSMDDVRPGGQYVEILFTQKVGDNGGDSQGMEQRS